MTYTLPRLTPEVVLALCNSAASRLQHPVNFGRHGLNVQVVRSLRGDVRLSVMSDTFQTDLIRLRAGRGVYVLPDSARLDVRIKAALDIIAPEIRDLESYVPHLTPGVWAVAGS